MTRAESEFKRRETPLWQKIATDPILTAKDSTVATLIEKQDYLTSLREGTSNDSTEINTVYEATRNSFIQDLFTLGLIKKEQKGIRKILSWKTDPRFMNDPELVLRTATKQIKGLQQDLALEVLKKYGVKKENVIVDRHILNFVRDDTQVRAQLNGQHLNILTWKASISFEERLEIWEKYAQEIRPQAYRLEAINDYLDGRGYAYLDKFAKQLYATMDEHAGEARQFNIKFYNFQIKNNFRDFTLQTPHIIQSLPIAISLATQPLDKVYDCISPFDSQGNGYLKVKEPGKFAPVSSRNSRPNIQWGLDEKGAVTPYSII